MPSLPHHESDHRGVVVWESGDISCRCENPTQNHIDITLNVKDTEIERRTFTDYDSATNYAIEKMHVYQALPPKDH
jgi:hypothetical protein